MSWDFIFSLTNGLALAGWLLLWFAPRKPVLLSLLMYLGVGLLCLVYAAGLATLLAGAGGAGNGAAPEFSYDIAGIRALFATDGGVVVGWTHYLAFDLFTGLWIARDADNKGFSRLAQLPVLAATFLAGPIGLLLWLGLREPAARAKARRAP